MFSDGLDFADDAVVATGDPGNEKAGLQRDHRSSQQPKNFVNGITTRNEMLQIEKFALLSATCVTPQGSRIKNSIEH